MGDFKIGIVGPNFIDEDDVERKLLLDRVAKIVAESGFEIVLTPDKNSLLEYFAKKYIEFGGAKVNLVVPDEYPFFNYFSEDVGEKVFCEKWQDQPWRINEESNAFVCLGYSWESMREIGCAQWSSPKKIYVLEEFVTARLPEELGFMVDYVEMAELKDELRKL